jgi:arylformamidase
MISNEMAVWPGDPAVQIENSLEIAKGDVCNLSRISMSVHCGTHIDAPRHFIENAAAVEEIPLDRMIGPCRVIDMTGISLITVKDLERIVISGTNRLLIKTDNSNTWKDGDSRNFFYKKFVALDQGAAGLIANLGLYLLGIDYLSVEAYDAHDSRPVHKSLLSAGIVLLEGLNLAGISAGEYSLICMPLNIAGADGAPARAALLEGNPFYDCS